jgi:ketosteroid isomerase-like protein
VSSSDDNRALGRAWLAAFNAGDLDALVALYADECTHTSPKLRAQRPESGGEIRGKDALRAWWADAFARLPGLRYAERAVTADDSRVVLEYVRHAPSDPPAAGSLAVAEAFDVRDGKIVASRVYHG